MGLRLTPMKYKIGDEVILKVDVSHTDVPYYEAFKVQVIGCGNGGDWRQYLCYVPGYLTLPRSFKLTRLHRKHYMFEDKFINEEGTFITEDDPIYDWIPTPLGSVCVNCELFVKWAEPNKGEIFYVCHDCKENPYR